MKRLGAHDEFDFSKVKVVDSRVRFIPRICKGKVVLSIGCVDMIADAGGVAGWMK